MSLFTAAQRWAQRSRPRAESAAGDEFVAEQLQWVLSSTSGWQRAWRSLVAARRCAKVAAERRASCRQ
jgi:hypothetical protein